MNLDLYPIGWLHSAFSIVALAAGAAVLVRPKGTPVHRLRGRIYVLALIATCLTSFAIYRVGKFWLPHWFGVAALIAVIGTTVLTGMLEFVTLLLYAPAMGCET